MSKRINIFVGGFGSGKTEIAINYSIDCKKRFQQVAIVDLDIVNPYFRSREVKEILKLQGVKMVSPEGKLTYSDVPIISPEIKGLIQNQDFRLILDVGGDDVGSVVLGNFRNFIKDFDYEMFLVVNIFRPFSRDVSQIKQMAREIEHTSRLKITGIVSNPNLSIETDEENIIEGHKKVVKASKALDIPIKFVCVDEQFIKKINKENIKESIFYIKTYMKLPWN
ncbi:MAG: hypothetical protein U9N08_06300 [Candidatus Caldatribacteriota bacterium]|nr:hypothetical protein [Candidatus Caldatribacteriota bacterium]